VSLYEKDCPQCTARNPAEALFCHCGYCFDPSRIRTTAETLAVVAHEERLYLEYLSARVTQRESDLKVAQRRASDHPDNAAFAAEVLLARQALNTARADRQVQLRKLNIVEAQIKADRKKSRTATKAAEKPAEVAKTNHTAKPAPTRPHKETKAAPAPRDTGKAKQATVTAKPPATVSATPAKPVEKPAPSPAPRAQVVKKEQPSAPVAKSSAPVVAAAPTTAVTQSPTPAPPPAAAAPRIEPKRQPRDDREALSASPVRPDTRAVAPAAPATPAPAVTPPPSLPAPKAMPASPTAPVISATPGPDFRAVQAARAEQIAPLAPPTPVAPPKPKPKPAAKAANKECPHCTASLPASTSVCRCGYHFSTGADIPSLTLSDADKAWLDDLDFSRPSPRR
jgi:hypothetical protein